MTVPDRRQFMFGKVPVPYTASWTGEEEFFVAPCKHANNQLAICQKVARGVGKPNFGKPHMIRQREVIINDLCDLCARPLRNRTKVSLSHARSRTHAAKPLDILQVEPLLHKECAAISIQHCPSLKRDIQSGAIEIRQVKRHAVQLAIYSAEGTRLATGTEVVSVSHAKVQLLSWVDRNEAWLTGGAS